MSFLSEIFLIHTSAGMVDIGIGTSEPFARWIADSFTVRAVVVDAKNRHYADTAKQPLLDLAADVLIQILRKESEE